MTNLKVFNAGASKISETVNAERAFWILLNHIHEYMSPKVKTNTKYKYTLLYSDSISCWLSVSFLERHNFHICLVFDISNTWQIYMSMYSHKVNKRYFCFNIEFWKIRLLMTVLIWNKYCFNWQKLCFSWPFFVFTFNETKHNKNFKIPPFFMDTTLGADVHSMDLIFSTQDPAVNLYSK